MQGSGGYLAKYQSGLAGLPVSWEKSQKGNRLVIPESGKAVSPWCGALTLFVRHWTLLLS